MLSKQEQQTQVAVARLFALPSPASRFLVSSSYGINGEPAVGWQVVSRALGFMAKLTATGEQQEERGQDGASFFFFFSSFLSSSFLSFCYIYYCYSYIYIYKCIYIYIHALFIICVYPDISV